MDRLPQVRPEQVIRALKKTGFIEDYQVGSHLVFIHPDTGYRTSVPQHPGDVARGLLRKILKQAGLTPEEFRELL